MKLLTYNAHFFIIFNIFFLLPISAVAQKVEKSALIDNYLQQSNKYYEVSNNLKSLEFAKKAYNLAKEEHLPHQTLESSICIASSLSALGLNDMALKYVLEGRKYCKKDDDLFQSKLDYIEAYILSDLNLPERAISNYNSISRRLKRSNDPRIVSHLFAVYQDLGTAYALLGKIDSVKKYDQLSKKLFPFLPNDESFETKSNFYYNQGSNYLNSEQRDSALMMFRKCAVLDAKDSLRTMGLGNLGLGNYYRLENPQKSLDYYLKVIQKVEKFNINITEFTVVYQSIADLYAKLGNKEKQEEFQKKYIAKIETEKKNNNKSIEKAISIIIDKQREEMLFTRSKIIIISVVCIAALLSLLYLVYTNAKQNKKKLNDNLQENQETIKTLKQQVNVSFDEVVELARHNSPQFWSRFQEVYPFFLEKMLAANPNLKTTELTFCAYIYLGFATKEIAEYTFKSPKTIENNRYNLRKKLFLTTDINLAVWIREYINT